MGGGTRKCKVSEPMLPLMVTCIQNNLSSKGLTLGFPKSESQDCGQWQHSQTMLLKALLVLSMIFYVTGLDGNPAARFGSGTRYQ
eukprot:scaffold19622_cov39-Attheya_sp.AAC.1